MQVVLLAAGASSRFWPLAEGEHKSLIPLMGKPLLRWTVESLERAGADEVVIVQDPRGSAEQALAGVSSPKLRFVTQKRPRGMGDALLQAEPYLEDSFFLMHPYHFDAEHLLSPLQRKAREAGVGCVLGAMRTDRPQDYGILKLDGDRAVDLVEKPHPQEAPSDLRVLGVYLLPKALLRDYREVVRHAPEHEHEYAFEEALKRAMRRRAVRVVRFERETPSLKYPWDLLEAVRLLMDAFLREPQISPSARIAESAIVEGPVHIGPEVRVFEHAVIKGPCYLGPRCVIGTGALVREYTDLEEGVLIGAHAEVTRSILGAGCTTHSGFFGDSVFAAGVKVGAGTITANVRVDRGEIASTVQGAPVPTGRRSLGAMVGESTQMGISCMLMPGVLIGSNCVIGPGTLVAENVPSQVRYFSRYQGICRRIR